MSNETNERNPEHQQGRPGEGAPGAVDEERGEPGAMGDEEREATATEAAAEQVETDLDRLTALERERDEYLELAQRTRADFENYRRRVAGEAAEARTRGKAELARELVPVLDNLDRALQAAGVADSGTGDEAPGDSLGRGVALVRDELRSTLERAGVESYDPTGERFDPSWHEALSTQPAEGTEAGVVLETVDRGYRLDGQVLRPARVIVSS